MQKNRASSIPAWIVISLLIPILLAGCLANVKFKVEPPPAKPLIAADLKENEEMFLLNGGTRTFEFNLRLKGKVTDMAGKPIANLPVRAYVRSESNYAEYEKLFEGKLLGETKTGRSGRFKIAYKTFIYDEVTRYELKKYSHIVFQFGPSFDKNACQNRQTQRIMAPAVEYLYDWDIRMEKYSGLITKMAKVAYYPEIRNQPHSRQDEVYTIIKEFPTDEDQDLALIQLEQKELTCEHRLRLNETEQKKVKNDLTRKIVQISSEAAKFYEEDLVAQSTSPAKKFLDPKLYRCGQFDSLTKQYIAQFGYDDFESAIKPKLSAFEHFPCAVPARP